MDINKIYCMDCLDALKDIPKPDLIVCDPPYEFTASGSGIMNKDKIMAKIRDIGTQHFDFNRYIQKILDTQQGNINAYFFCSKTLLPAYLHIAQKNKCSFDMLFLVKNNPVPCKNNHYAIDTEYCVFMRKGKNHFNNGFPFNYYKKHHYITIGSFSGCHLNEKPIEMIRKMIKISSNEGDLVLDCFMGSGTTAVACKDLKRNFIGFELLQKYVDQMRKMKNCVLMF